MLKINQPLLFNQIPDGILFDTDNTLYPYDPAHQKAMGALKQKISKTLNVSAKDVEKNFNKARSEVKKLLKNSAASHSRLLYIQRMLEFFGLGSQVLLALDFEQTYWRVFLSEAKLFPFLEKFLEELRLLQVPMAIVTDLTAQIQFRKMVYFDLDHYFDYIVTSEEAGHDKPHRLPFEISLKKMNLNRKNNIWFIGDNPKNDIEGAKKHINATTLHKIHTGVLRSSGRYKADLEFNEYNDLYRLIKKLKNND
jgi:HAD superfamily hydrolase (TIGR01549 family)